ncbi:MAG: mannonate dehydratase [Firmicutes bacterium]|nr:mannonate dehydratase [Bacillota bacterium]
MKMSMRWYGPPDPVTLTHIRQVPGVRGVVTSLYELPAGAAWPQRAIAELKAQIEAAGLEWTVVESVPVHEDIKLGGPTRTAYIEAYTETLRNLAACGVHTVCYNFMPLFDWLRTSLAHPLADGSNTLAYLDEQVDEAALMSGQLRLPAWSAAGDADRLLELRAAYRELGESGLWETLAHFLQCVAPVAESLGIRLALHPDDPPWSVLGIPRIIVDRASLRRVLDLCDAPASGLCFCSGSLGAREDNDLPAMIREFGGRHRIHFVHLRNLNRIGPRSFYESGHLSAQGSIDMGALAQALAEVGYTGPVRPDHGRMIWGETGNPGYGLYDRALGAMYLQGLWEGLTRDPHQTRGRGDGASA